MHASFNNLDIINKGNKKYFLICLNIKRSRCDLINRIIRNCNNMKNFYIKKISIYIIVLGKNHETVSVIK